MTLCGLCIMQEGAIHVTNFFLSQIKKEAIIFCVHVTPIPGHATWRQMHR